MNFQNFRLPVRHTPGILALLALASCNSGDPAPTGIPNEVNAQVQIPQSEIIGEEAGRRKPKPTTSPSPSPTVTATATPAPVPAPSPTATATPAPSPSPSPTVKPPYTTQALIFNGVGVNASNGQAVIDLVRSHGWTYRVVDTTALNAMSLADLASYGVIIWPGGNADEMNAVLYPETRQRVRQAVRDYGVGYTGFCAGAWIAVGPDPGPASPWWGHAIVGSNYLKEYSPDGLNPPAGYMVPITFANGSVRQIVWWQGPYLPNLTAGTIGRYKDGIPAIGQAWSGKGFVTLSGVHPEAPWDWRSYGGLTDTDGMDQHIAWSMIEAALYKRPMATF